MSVLVKNVTVIDDKSPYNGKRVDIGYKRGSIEEIGKVTPSNYGNIIEGSNLFVSPSWIDCHAQFNDPGNEHKEDIISGAKAAKAGGFGTVVTSANTAPIVDSKAHIKYISSLQSELATEVRSLAALSEQLKGQNFNELFDLQSAGAVAFCDGHNGIENADLLKRAMLYANPFNGRIMVYPHSYTLGQGGVMNEGEMSTQLGLKSDPSLSEEIMVARDLAIAEYCETPIHFMTITSAKSVRLIKKAKEKGIKVTCDVAIANLIWNDSELAQFDVNFKLVPPLRSEADRKALIKGVNNGTIDFIVSNHMPQNIEEKNCEFNHAGPGQSIIQLMFPLYHTYLAKDISMNTFINAISDQPRTYLGLEIPGIDKGNKTSLTVFSTAEKTMVNSAMWESKSFNTPFMNKELNGKVLALLR